jgi:hypothetical protein
VALQGKAYKWSCRGSHSEAVEGATVELRAKALWRSCSVPQWSCEGGPMVELQGKGL